MKETSLNNVTRLYKKGTTSITNITSTSIQRNKVRDIVAHLIREIETGTKSPLTLLKKELTEQNLFFISLQHVVTTKKILCYALDIPIESACRYKRYLEKSGKLVQSSHKVICPLTKHWAHLLTTNPKKFEKVYFGQLTLF